MSRLAAWAAYARARRDLLQNSLDEYAAGIGGETPEFLAANRAAAIAGRRVPFRVRRVISTLIMVRMRYRKRMGL